MFYTWVLDYRSMICPGKAINVAIWLVSFNWKIVLQALSFQGVYVGGYTFTFYDEVWHRGVRSTASAPT